VPLAEVIGRNLRAFRESAGGSQDWLAHVLQDYGLNWNRSQLAKAERGERIFTFEQIVLIAVAFDMPIAELVQGDRDEQVVLTAGATIDATIDHELLAAVVDGTDVRERMKLRPQHYFVSERVREETRARLTVEQSQWEAEHAADLITEEVAQEWWGHPFIVERERRVAQRLGLDPPSADMSLGDAVGPVPGVEAKTLAAVRGHATRELGDELSPEIRRRLAAKQSKTREAKRPRARAPKRGRKR
jgi:transcriptional regulator with XRE-family HTH domain